MTASALASAPSTDTGNLTRRWVAVPSIRIWCSSTLLSWRSRCQIRAD
jgi:hypothetical protein